MKVTAKWKYSNGRKFELKEIDVDYCCYEMEHTDCIKFGEFDGLLNQNQDVNIAKYSSYPECGYYTEEKINYCPFCGTSIEINVIEQMTYGA